MEFDVISLLFPLIPLLNVLNGIQVHMQAY